MNFNGKIVTIRWNGEDGIPIPLTTFSCLFGASSSCNICVAHPAVAPEHCRLNVRHDGEVFLTCFCPNDPTVLNGKPVKQITKIKHGDIIRVIDQKFRFEYPLGSKFRILKQENSEGTPRREDSPKHEPLRERHQSTPAGFCHVPSTPPPPSPRQQEELQDGEKRRRSSRNRRKNVCPCCGVDAETSSKTAGLSSTGALHNHLGAEPCDAASPSRPNTRSKHASAPTPGRHHNIHNQNTKENVSQNKDDNSRPMKESLGQNGSSTSTPRRNRSKSGHGTFHPGSAPASAAASSPKPRTGDLNKSFAEDCESSTKKTPTNHAGSKSYGTFADSRPESQANRQSATGGTFHRRSVPASAAASSPKPHTAYLHKSFSEDCGSSTKKTPTNHTRSYGTFADSRSESQANRQSATGGTFHRRSMPASAAASSPKPHTDYLNKSFSEDCGSSTKKTSTNHTRSYGTFADRRPESQTNHESARGPARQSGSVSRKEACFNNGDASRTAASASDIPSPCTPKAHTPTSATFQSNNTKSQLNASFAEYLTDGEDRYKDAFNQIPDFCACGNSCDDDRGHSDPSCFDLGKGHMNRACTSPRGNPRTQKRKCDTDYIPRKRPKIGEPLDGNESGGFCSASMPSYPDSSTRSEEAADHGADDSSQKEGSDAFIDDDVPTDDSQDRLQEECNNESYADFIKQLGNNYFRDGHYSVALKYYTYAIERYPDRGYYYGNRAATYIKLRQFDRALIDAKRSTMLDPNFIKGYLREAQCHLVTGDAASAVDIYQKVLRREPNNSEASSQLEQAQKLLTLVTETRAAYAQNDFQKVLSCTEQCIELVPDCQQFLVDKAESLAFLHSFDEARAITDTLSQADAQKVDIPYIRGLCFYYENKLSDAKQHFLSVVKLDPDHKKTVDAFQKMKRIMRKKEEGDCAMSARSYWRAEDSYTEALSIDPINKIVNCELLTSRASLYFHKLKRFEDAISDLTRLLSLDEDNANAFRQRGQCYMRLHNYDSAIVDFELAGELEQSSENTSLLKEATEMLARQPKDYYAILDIPYCSTLNDLKPAYYLKARQHHPDRHCTAPSYVRRKQERMFKSCLRAYEELQKKLV